MGSGMSTYEQNTTYGYGCKAKVSKECGHEHIKVTSCKRGGATSVDENGYAPVAYIKLFGRTVGALRAGEACECFTRELGKEFETFPEAETDSKVHFATSLQVEGATIRAGCCKIVGNNNIIYGHMNEITGNGNTVTGNMNKVAGDRSAVRGNMNNVEGNNPTVSGSMNSIRGNNGDVRGNMNSTTGHGNVSNGRMSSTTTGFFSQPPVSFELDPRSVADTYTAPVHEEHREMAPRVPEYPSYYSDEKAKVTRGVASSGRTQEEADGSNSTRNFVVVMPDPPADTAAAPPPYVYPTFDDRN